VDVSRTLKHLVDVGRYLVLETFQVLETGTFKNLECFKNQVGGCFIHLPGS
jgi:hypothetical protein